MSAADDVQAFDLDEDRFGRQDADLVPDDSRADVVPGAPRLVYAPVPRGRFGYVDPLLSVLTGLVQLDADQSNTGHEQVRIRAEVGGNYSQVVPAEDVELVPAQVAHAGDEWMLPTCDGPADEYAGTTWTVAREEDVTCPACLAMLALVQDSERV